MKEIKHVVIVYPSNFRYAAEADTGLALDDAGIKNAVLAYAFRAELLSHLEGNLDVSDISILCVSEELNHGNGIDLVKELNDMGYANPVLLIGAESVPEGHSEQVTTIPMVAESIAHRVTELLIS